MSPVAVTVLPVFSVIALGYAAARLRWIGDAGADGLSRFVFLFAIPALLFRTMLRMDASAGIPWALWASYFLAAATVWLCGILVSRRVGGLDDAAGAATAMAASFSNLVLLGLPLAVAHFGTEAAVPAGLIVAVHAPIHWFAATLRATWAQRTAERSLAATLTELGVTLGRNPIVMAIVAGIAWNAAGLGLHPIADRTIALLGQGGVPAALFALGLSLAAFRLGGGFSAVATILALKMLCFPLLAWALSVHVFALSPLTAAVVVLCASMPPGANAYLFSVRYQSAVTVVSGAIFLGTGLSVFTTAVVLWAMGSR